MKILCQKFLFNVFICLGTDIDVLKVLITKFDISGVKLRDEKFKNNHVETSFLI